MINNRYDRTAVANIRFASRSQKPIVIITAQTAKHPNASKNEKQHTDANI
jgi:hypothetical protein